MEMIWEEPPAPLHSGGKSARVQAILEQLKANPGRWAVVAEHDGRSGGNAAHWKKKGCEATTRRRNGKIRTYARWPQDATTPPPVVRSAPAAEQPRSPKPAASRAGEKKGITPADVDGMVQMQAEGKTQAEIGAVYGISNVTVGYHLRRRAKAEAATANPAETATPAAAQKPTPASARDAEDDGPAPTLGSVRRATLVAQHTKGTCRTCGARNRGLTDGQCRMCTIRAKEKAALAEDGADQ